MIPDSKRFAFSHSPGNVLILPFGEIVNDDDISSDGSDIIIEVQQLLGDNKVTTSHVNRIKRLAGPELNETTELVTAALHSKQRFEVDYITTWRLVDNDIQLQVHWKGWQECDRTWENAVTLHEDVPATVINYLQEVQNDHVKLRDLLHTLN